MKTFLIDNITIKLGESAKENWDLAFSSNNEYIWVHLASFPSAHIIIENECPETNIINQAGQLCKAHSKYRNLKNVKMSVTTCSNLKRGSKPGEVYFKSNRKVKEYVIR